MCFGAFAVVEHRVVHHIANVLDVLLLLAFVRAGGGELLIIEYIVKFILFYVTLEQLPSLGSNPGRPITDKVRHSPDKLNLHHDPKQRQKMKKHTIRGICFTRPQGNSKISHQ